MSYFESNVVFYIVCVDRGFTLAFVEAAMVN